MGMQNQQFMARCCYRLGWRQVMVLRVPYNFFNIGNYYGSGGANELTETWEHYYRGIRKCNMNSTD